MNVAPYFEKGVTANELLCQGSARVVDARTMIGAAREACVLPVRVTRERISSTCGLIPRTIGEAQVAHYADGSSAAVGLVGTRHVALMPDEIDAIASAVESVGGAPSAVFTLAGGTKTFLEFSLPGDGRFRSSMVIGDSYDSSRTLGAGLRASRIRCANQIAAAFGEANQISIRHTSSLPEKVRQLCDAVRMLTEASKSLAATYDRARAARVTPADIERILADLFPPPEEGATKNAVTRHESEITDMVRAMARSENREGNSLATVWNGATWLVDRDADGTPRKARAGSDRVASELFGSQAKRVTEIRQVVLQYLADGTLVEREVVAPSDDNATGQTVNIFDLDVAN